MRLANIPIDQAEGSVLVHNVADAHGHKALLKGHRLIAADIEKLRALGRSQVYVALLDPGDVRENDAVTRIGKATAGENTSATLASGGRVNLLATGHGILKLNGEALRRLNLIDGVTVATRPAHSLAEPKTMLATIKTIGLALTESTLKDVEAIRTEFGAAIWVRPFSAARVGIVFTGSEAARRRVEDTFGGPVRARIAALGAEVESYRYVPEEVPAIADAISSAMSGGANCIILVGETSIMDAEDITPRGIKAAGGEIEVYGAPVEPGNLLMLAYIGQVPILGAPGCIQSRETNVVDLVLPRLLAGERVTRSDVIALADGGLLI